MTIETMLVISTGHVTLKTAKMLDSNPNIWPVKGYRHGEYGWLFPVPPEIEEHIPLDLYRVLSAAKEQGCVWLLMDRDAEALDDLKVFDW